MFIEHGQRYTAVRWHSFPPTLHWIVTPLLFLETLTCAHSPTTVRLYRAPSFTTIHPVSPTRASNGRPLRPRRPSNGHGCASTCWHSSSRFAAVPMHFRTPLLCGTPGSLKRSYLPRALLYRDGKGYRLRCAARIPRPLCGGVGFCEISSPGAQLRTVHANCRIA